MKTHFLFSTLLALAIQVMVNGQTSGSRTHKVRVTLGAVKTAAQTQKQNTSKPAPINQLMESADYFNSASVKFKTESASRVSMEKEMMLVESEDLRFRAILKEIEASEANAKVNDQTYSKNVVVIKDLLEKQTENLDDVDHALNLIEDAKKAYASSKQMRSEAYAEIHPSSTLGILGNAEEKEYIAISSQNKAIQLLEEGVAALKIKSSAIAFQEPSPR